MTSTREDSTEYDKLMWPIITSFRPTACWPNRSELEGVHNIKNVLRNLHRYFAIASMSILTLGIVLQVVHFWGEDMNDTIECCILAATTSLIVFRILVFNSNQKDMLYIVETMREDWSRSSVDKKLILHHKCLFAFKMAKIFFISAVVTTLAFIAMPILEMMSSGEERKKLPFDGYYYFDHTGTPIFQFFYVANTLISAMGCSTVSAGACFVLIATVHGAAKFAIVQKDFQSISSSDWIMSENLAKFVQRHQECIRYAEKVEKIMNNLVLMQFVLSGGIVSCIGFQLTTMLKDKDRLIKYLSFMPSKLMELFMYSYAGQCLKSESENVAECVYSSNWIGIFLPNSIQLIVIRAQKPCTITAGKFYDMSFESFLKLLSTAFSYFTVLLALVDT